MTSSTSVLTSDTASDACSGLLIVEADPVQPAKNIRPTSKIIIIAIVFLFSIFILLFDFQLFEQQLVLMLAEDFELLTAAAIA